MPTPSPDASGAPDDLDKRFKWRILPIIVFGLSMVVLTAIASVALLSPPRIVSGLPDDPAARSAQALLGPPPSLSSGTLRFRSALTGESAPGAAISAAQARAAAAAESVLAAGLPRYPMDARAHAALGHLNLTRRLLERAEQHYRRAIDLAPHCGEARLGYGVALALRAEITTDPLLQRALLLRALAQSAAVDAQDPVATDALYNRARLAADVGRRAEARAAAERYWANDASSEWARQLRARVESGGR